MHVSIVAPISTALINLMAATVGGAALAGFLAQQRWRRLDQQLKELIKIVNGEYLNEEEAVFLEKDEMQAKWNKELELINDDVEKGADKFVRLNARSKHELELLLTKLPETNIVITILYGNETAELKTTQQHALERIQYFRANLGIYSFFESPWPVRIKD